MTFSLGRTAGGGLGPCLVLASCLTMWACDDDKSSPEAVSLTELKAASGLKILDMGNGSIKLTWRGMNNEEDFSGYNIYGAKDDGNKTYVNLAGSSIDLLTDAGEPNTAAVDLLKGLSYNGTDWETPGAKESTDADDVIKWPAYYKEMNDNDEPVLPSCRPETNGTCTLNTKATETAATTALNGFTSITLTVKAGGTYCFTVLATLDNGHKVAQATSEIRCVTTRFQVAQTGFTMSDASADTEHYTVDIAAIRAKCAAGDCGTMAGVAQSAFCTGSTTQAFCFEYFPDGAETTQMTSGADVSLQDLGYYAGGLDDPNVPRPVAVDADGTIAKGQGWSLPGQSIRVLNKHVYMIAEKGSDGNWYYHSMYIDSLTDDGSTAKFDYTVRINTVPKEFNGNQ